MFRRFISILLIILSLLSAGVTTSASATSDFFFFFPDSVQTNMVQLKRDMDAFFKKAGLNINFLPFVHVADFDRMSKASMPALILLPEWYYRTYGKTLGVTPLLVPVRQGKANYTKLLLINKAKDYAIEELAGKTIGMTSMGQDTINILNKELFSSQNLDFTRCNIITTAKDADALYALILKQVDAAVVSSDVLQAISRINPALFSMVKTLAISEPVPMPVLCVSIERMEKDDMEKLKDIFLIKGGQSSPSAIMETLHIDGWKTVTP